jgi:2-polyprenyl-6-hydroxyphenyl methylase / 3-demethylubiquinone-9 3-methyltransferase
MASLANDLTIYDERASEWWDAGGTAFRSLRAVHAFRSRLLFGWLGDEAARGPVVDVGCGGGYFAEDFARRGAAVLGIDLSRPSLAAAGKHAAEIAGTRPAYARANALALPVRDASVHGVLLADVLEHLDWARALREAARALHPGGWIYVSTINRGFLASLLAVRLAEGLGFIPKGTHDPKMFIRPDELARKAASAGLDVVKTVGERPRLVATVWSGTIELTESRSLGVAYSVLLRRK